MKSVHVKGRLAQEFCDTFTIQTDAPLFYLMNAIWLAIFSILFVLYCFQRKKDNAETKPLLFPTSSKHKYTVKSVGSYWTLQIVTLLMSLWMIFLAFTPLVIGCEVERKLGAYGVVSLAWIFCLIELSLEHKREGTNKISVASPLFYLGNLTLSAYYLLKTEENLIVVYLPAVIFSAIGFLFGVLYALFGCRVTHYSQIPAAHVTAGLWDYISFNYARPLLKTGWNRQLTMEDIAAVDEYDQTHLVYQELQEIIAINRSKGRTFVLWDLFYLTKWTLIKQMGAAMVGSLIVLVNPIVIKVITNYLTEEYNRAHGIEVSESIRTNSEVVMGSIFLLLIVPLIAAIAQGQSLFNGRLTCIRIKSALVSLIYRKSLRLDMTSPENKQEEIVNLMSVDTPKCSELSAYLSDMITSPIQLVLLMILLFSNIGYSAFVGLACMITIGPLTRVTAGVSSKYYATIMAKKDSRIASVTDIFTGIRVIKLFAWENTYLAKVLERRNDELSSIKQLGYLSSVFQALFVATDMLTSAITLIFHARVFGHPLSMADALATQTIFTLLSKPLMDASFLINWASRVKVSLERIDKHLNRPESKSADHVYREQDLQSEIGSAIIKAGIFKWMAASDITLKDINLEIVPRTLTCIIGAVGCGKSSLLNALLKEINILEGTVDINGKIAYVPQKAWIQNATIRENILFGKEFDAEKYNRVIRACSLEHDLRIMKDSDQTEIGEKGITLSGGQQQRISLARAAYSDADIYILDDCLSAVDAHVCNRLFKDCINGLLKNKTRILVTHQVATCLPKCDHVILIEDGKIAKQGTSADFSSQSDGSQLSKAPSFVTSHSTDLDGHDLQETDAKGAKLVLEEEKSSGIVEMRIVLAYIKAMGGWCMALLLAFFLGFSVLTGYLVNWAMTRWFYIGIESSSAFFLYLGCCCLGFIIPMILSVINTFASIQASSLLHKNLISNLIRSPMSFFERTPMGRILNRFSSDMDEIDNTMSYAWQGFLYQVLSAIYTLLLCIYASWWFVVGMIPSAIAFFYVGVYYQNSAREIKRFDAVTRSPIYSHFGESLDGVISIRAYGVQERFINENAKKVDSNNSPFFTLWICNRWLAFHLNLVSGIVSFSAGCAIVLVASTLTPSVAGLALMYAMTISDALTWTIRNYAQMEMSLNSVERVVEYINLPQEAAAVIKDTEPAKEWPQHGFVQVRDLVMKYPNASDPAINRISFDILANMSVGIVGRTGAGKSTLALALFRLIEPIGGSILIDGVDIGKLGLETLRSKLSIIPQEPVLFKGTLRSNLDPLELYDEDQLWNALDRVDLKKKISSYDKKLDCEVQENGSNFSVGQRQLICMARALLRRSKVLVMDEATANVDHDTDKLIQSTLRREFSSCTVICIAHRIHTIIDFDRVLVLQNGKIAEYDTPRALLKANGPFKKFCEDTGDYKSLEKKAK